MTTSPPAIPFDVPPPDVLAELRARAAGRRPSRFVDPQQAARVLRYWRSQQPWCVQVLGYQPGLALVSRTARRLLAQGQQTSLDPDLPALSDTDLELLDLAADWNTNRQRPATGQA